MEKNFYPDNFEQLLKESADNFRMYPSKRVWHSIYNDLHPSRRWPSLAIWILLISSIVYVGLTNKSDIITGADNKVVSATSTNPNNTNSNQSTSNTITETEHVLAQVPANKKATNTTSYNNVDNIVANDLADQSFNKQSKLQSVNNNVRISGNKKYVKIQLPGTDTNGQVDADIKNQSTAVVSANDKTNSQVVPINDLGSITATTPERNSEIAVNDLSSKNADPKKENTDKKIILGNNNSDKEWIEDYAFHNKPFAQKWKTNTTYELYFTPSVGYRILSRNSAYNITTPSLIATTGNRNMDYKNALSQTAAVNVEVGGSLLYSISKNWRLKGGVQLNYTNYTINAYELNHPTVTTLTLNDFNTGLPALQSRSTTLANPSGVSSKKLNSSTYQVSIPLGAYLKLAGKNNLKWYAGVTVQPTYIADGNAYLISTDLKNYVEDKSMLRKWNFNAAVETFISYKTAGGIIINAGPQFRYQLMSSYSSQYNYNEKLYNIGLKIGIVTRF